LNNITEYGVDIYKFYPRCYDLSDVKQIDYFQEDFNRTSILNIIKRHARHFKRLFGGKIKEIGREHDRIQDNIYRFQNKKKFKNKYHR
jgi:hypothetical protein